MASLHPSQDPQNLLNGSHAASLRALFFGVMTISEEGFLHSRSNNFIVRLLTLYILYRICKSAYQPSCGQLTSASSRRLLSMCSEKGKPPLENNNMSIHLR